MKPIYLDYNATTPIAKEVVEAMLPFLKQNFGNPSSSHYYGKKARKAVEEARRQVASLINAKPEEIVFTSGGTESNNFALMGIAYAYSESGRNHIITSAIEHPAVINVCRKLSEFGFKITYIPVDKWGKIDLSALEESIRQDTVLISIMSANNEIGTIQPVNEIGEIAQKHEIIFHTDAAQALGKIPVDVKGSNIDSLSLAGHKFYAPKGVGALYIKNGLDLEKFMYGAGQENGRRPGTENVPEIVGLGKAAELARSNYPSSANHMRKLRDMLHDIFFSSPLDFVRNGDPDDCLPNTLSLSFAGVNALDVTKNTNKIAFSTGAACHSDDAKISSVLQAIGVPEKYARGTIRLSTGKYNTTEEIEIAAEKLVNVIMELQND